MINHDYKDKRWKVKRELTDKLDRYITIQESQIDGYKAKIDNYKTNFDKLKAELDEYLFRLNQGNVLLTKFKKKCYN